MRGCIIQFFDQDSLLLPPFTYLTIKYLSRYARLYNIIQFFDQDSLLPPPFTFLTLIMYCVRQMLKISLPFYIQSQYFYFSYSWLIKLLRSKFHSSVLLFLLVFLESLNEWNILYKKDNFYLIGNEISILFRFFAKSKCLKKGKLIELNLWCFKSFAYLSLSEFHPYFGMLLFMINHKIGREKFICYAGL